jgi:hypothetical protein
VFCRKGCRGMPRAALLGLQYDCTRNASEEDSKSAGGRLAAVGLVISDWGESMGEPVL